MTLMFPDKHAHGMDEMSFNALFTEGAPVIFAFHNNRWLIHTLVHGRSNEGRFHVHGYMDYGHDHHTVRHGRAERNEPLPPCAGCIEAHPPPSFAG
jgi:phosphoketolase